MIVTEKVKASRIVNEVISYFVINDILDFDLNFNIDEYRFKLDLVARVGEKPKNFDRFMADLQVPRQMELEEYYNSLLGCQGHHIDYRFLGESIDSAVGSYEDGTIKLTLIRYKVV